VLHSLGVVWTVVARCSTRLRHWRRVGSRAAADEDRKPVDRERLLLPCLPSPAVHLPITCKATQQHKQFPVLPFFRSASASLLPLDFLLFPSFSGANAAVACCHLDGWRSEKKLSGLVACRWSSILLVAAVVGLAAVVRGVYWWRPVCEPVGVGLAAALATAKRKKNFGRRLDFQREGFSRWLRESRFSCLGERPFGREPAEERGRSVCTGGRSVWLRVRGWGFLLLGNWGEWAREAALVFGEDGNGGSCSVSWRMTDRWGWRRLVSSLWGRRVSGCVVVCCEGGEAEVEGWNGRGNGDERGGWVCWRRWGEKENQRGGAASLCKQGKGGLRPPLLNLVFSTGRGGTLEKKMGLGLGIFFWCCSKLPLLKKISVAWYL